MKYIRKGLKLNPDSHDGSEWIHVKILEAKIALEKDPNYLNTHSVLNLHSKQKQSQKVFDQLYIQLQERFPFSPKEANPVMADLFIEMGDFYLDNISFEHAKAFYQIAKIYYKSSRKEVDEKIDRARKLRETYAHFQPGMAGMKHEVPKNTKTAPHPVMESKITGVPYQNYVYNPAGSSHVINWSKIETDPDKLLTFLDIKQSEGKQKTAEPEKQEKTTLKKEAKSTAQKNQPIPCFG